MSLRSLAVSANPMCLALPPPFDSPTLVFEEREMRRLVQVRASVCVHMCARDTLKHHTFIYPDAAASCCCCT